MSQTIEDRYPWVKRPLIANGPMGGFAGPRLATEVSLNGGFGFIGSDSFEEIEKHLQEARILLQNERILGPSETMPVGIGFLLFYHKLEDIAPLIKKYQPAAVWLFAAPTLNDYTKWADRIRQCCPQTSIWIQVGSVADAMTVVAEARPDVLVAQGSDAGGHGLEKGAGIVSLVPEISAKLATLSIKAPLLMAAGGIVDGRGVATALCLGACGAVMGTRFLCSDEITIPSGHQRAVLNANDGGQNTVRSKVFDEVRGPSIWPQLYDGRGILSESYSDWKQGISIDEIRNKHSKALEMPDQGFGVSSGQGRAVIWAGTAVGLVNDIQKAGDIVTAARAEAVDVLDRVRQTLANVQ